MQHRVDVLEQAGAHHVDFAGAALFGRGAVKAHCAGEMMAGQVIFDGDGGERPAGAQQIVAAAVAGSVGCDHLTFRYGVLGEAGQGVELAENGDHRFALAEAGNESGGNLGHPESGDRRSRRSGL